MNCKKCGSLLTENDQICKNCGASVNAQEEQNNVQQSMNNQPDLMQQPMNNQSEPMQQPMSNPQPMNNMQQNYSNNNQNSWQNSYNPTPNFQQQRPNGNGKYVIIGIVVAVVVVGIIMAISILGNKGNNNYSGGNSGGSGITNTSNNSTYTVKFQGFTFKVPTNLIYDTDTDALYIGDEAGTWQAAIEVVSRSFSQLQTNKNQLISVYQQAGYGAANVNQKTYGGLDFITIELTHSGQKAILGFTKANSMYVFGATAFNLDNDFDYSLLSDVAKVLSTAEYSGETNNISGFNKVDMGPVNELVK